MALHSAGFRMDRESPDLRCLGERGCPNNAVQFDWFLDLPETEVTNHWIAARLEMAHENSINRQIRHGKTDTKTMKTVRKLEKMFRRVD